MLWKFSVDDWMNTFVYYFKQNGVKHRTILTGVCSSAATDPNKLKHRLWWRFVWSDDFVYTTSYCAGYECECTHYRRDIRCYGCIRTVSVCSCESTAIITQRLCRWLHLSNKFKHAPFDMVVSFPPSPNDDGTERSLLYQTVVLCHCIIVFVRQAENIQSMYLTKCSYISNHILQPIACCFILLIYKLCTEIYEHTETVLCL